MKIKSITHMLKEFVSTFEEWHYFIGGIAIGYILGNIFGSLGTVLIVWITGRVI